MPDKPLICPECPYEKTATLTQALKVRLLHNWKSTLAGSCGLIATLVPVLVSNGVTSRRITMLGALSLAVTTWLSKDK